MQTGHENPVPVPKRYERFVAICEAKTREEERAAWLKAFDGDLPEWKLKMLMGEDEDEETSET